MERLKKKHACNHGQISILMIFSLIPMFTLFAFVVNIGMLVHAKISLQNAADLAAYAGAATQARQLSHISHLNYQMRQTFKRFLFKYYVIGNMSQRCFPRPGGVNPPECGPKPAPNAAYNWINVDRNGKKTGFPGVPMVCLNTNPEVNPCQLAEAVAIVKPPNCLPIDPTCGALQNAAKAIALIQQKSCSGNSSMNSEVLGNWLYATDYDIQMKTQGALDGFISNDLGLVTEELLLYHRIQTVQSFINKRPFKGVTLSQIRSLEANADPAPHERLLLAFKTALGNLNSKIFDPDDITFSELLPNEDVLSLKPIKPEFKVGITYMDSSDASAGCVMALDYLAAKPVVAVVKQSNELIYYAVKLTAKAKLLFNPFPLGGSPDGDIELTAYSAAMPFGSRIGPVVSEEDFIRQGKPTLGNGKPGDAILYPTLKIGPEWTYESNAVLEAFHQAINPDNKGGAVSKQDYDRGLRAAMLPDEYEVGQYNIPVDTEYLKRPANDPKEFLTYYRSANESGQDKNYTFWAPLFGQGQSDEFSEAMKGEIENYISFFTVGPTDNIMQETKKVLAGMLLSKLESLISSLQSRNNLNVAQIPDALASVYFQNNGPYPNIPGKIAGEDASGVAPRLATSYTSEHDSIYYQNGRVGYSVKFIPFRMLTQKPGLLTNTGGSTVWKSMNGAFGPDLSDVNKIAH